MGSYSEKDPDYWKIAYQDKTVLGVTAEGGLALTLGFVRSEVTREIRPFIDAWGEDESDKVIAIRRDDGSLLYYDPDKISTSAQKREILNALETLSDIKISLEQNAALKALGNKADVHLNPVMH